MQNKSRQSTAFDHGLLQQKGLNLQAVFNLADLPAELITSIKPAVKHRENFHQLILLAHAGKTLWTALATCNIQSDNPVDDFCITTTEQFLSEHYPQNNFEIIYPGTYPVGLQQLGKLAGWHHDSPFKVGINSEWGSWFAYRVAILADTNFTPTTPVLSASPCDSCAEKFCIVACPPRACDAEFDLMKCVSYRKQNASCCRDQCLARLACPAGKEHKYSAEQIRYHYSISMKTIEEYY